jgi:hypothetical protein
MIRSVEILRLHIPRRVFEQPIHDGYRTGLNSVNEQAVASARLCEIP